MSRLIYADLLLLALDKRKTYELADGRNRAYGKGLRDAMKDVNDQPTVDAVPVVHGKWVESNPNNSDSCRLIKCSKCGYCYIVGFNVPYDIWMSEMHLMMDTVVARKNLLMLLLWCGVKTASMVKSTIQIFQISICAIITEVIGILEIIFAVMERR